MIEFFKRNGKKFLWGEMLLFYLLPPFVFYAANASRIALFAFLWLATGGALIFLRLGRGQTWREIWQGNGWPRTDRRKAVARFLALSPVLALSTLFYAPDRFLTFPFERPGLWLAVMLLYPFLSALPQSLLFRSFFYARYESLFPNPWTAIVVNGVFFGFAHSLYGNWIAPTFSALGGMIMAGSFRRHRSLKWTLVEHAAYGCLIFTLGIGWFFFKHG